MGTFNSRERVRVFDKLEAHIKAATECTVSNSLFWRVEMEEKLGEKSITCSQQSRTSSP